MTSNNMYRILLAVKPRLLSDALRRRLEADADAQVVGEVDNDLDLLLAVRATEANVVVQSWPTGEMPAIVTHLLVEFPGLSLLGLPAQGQGAVLCQQRLTQTPLAADLDGILNSLRTEAADSANQRVGSQS
jgi:DNA-binding NarL/FixJ family response regulator